MNGNMKGDIVRKESSDYMYALPLRSKNQLYALCNMLETYNIDTSSIELNLIRSADNLTMMIKLEAYIKIADIKTEFIEVQRCYFKMTPFLIATKKEPVSSDKTMRIKHKTNLTLLHSLQSEEAFLLN